MIKTVIFDIDGTMYDYENGNIAAIREVEQYCMVVLGIGSDVFHQALKDAEQVQNNRIGYNCASIHNRLIRYQCLLELLGQPVVPHALKMYHNYWDMMLEQMKPYPDLPDFMQLLKQQGIRIGIGTNMTAYIQYQKLERLGVGELTDWIVTSEEAGVEKPDPRFYQLCIEKSGHQPEECFFIGDNYQSDVEGPKQAGMNACWFGQDSEGKGITSYKQLMERFDNTNMN